MKNILRSILIIPILLAVTLTGLGQPALFAPKSKATPHPAFAPGPMKALPGVNHPSTAPRTANFRPVSHPLPLSSQRTLLEGEKHYNSHGQLIFFSGSLPGNPARALGGSPAMEEACFQYLDGLSTVLHVSMPRQEFIVENQSTDELGITHIKMQQVYKGIPVYNGGIILHARSGQVDLLTGLPFPTPGLTELAPVVTSPEAAGIALSDLTRHTAVRELDANQRSLLSYQGPVSELVIYPKNRDPEQLFLAWHLTLRPNFIERWEYFIDARTGSILHYYNNTQTDGDVSYTGPDLNGVNRTIHAYLENGTYLMVDVTRPMFNPQNSEGTLRVYDANNTSPSGSTFNPALCTSNVNSWGPKVVSSQNNSGVTYEYFRSVHGKNSWNNQGGSLLSVINASDDNGGGLDNAYWNGVCIIYGNGATYFKPLAGALDVGAHEIGHAFDQGSANLEYQYQSGAMNEAFADIAAAVVERANWKIGEDVAKPAYFPTGCLRDMSNPHNGGNSLGDPGYQPANVSEMYNGSDDNGGVHINSGIINFAFYKYATAVGMNKGEMTFFRALFNYLTRSSQFIDCRLAVVQSAKDLYGDNSAEMNAAKTAFDEVGITDGTGGNYQNTLPVNPGQDYILVYNTYSGDPNTLYISNTAGTQFTPISQTPLLNKPSIVDNGSVAVFIGNDKLIHAISLVSPYQESIIQNEPVWSNVAVSKDGMLIAAVTQNQDSTIYIYSFALSQWATAHLYNPTTQQGIVNYNVLYADALEWDYSSEFIMYDAYNQMNSSTTGQNVDYWDISFMNVWNKAATTWGSGEVFKLVSGLPEGISIGNPSLSKNSPSVCAFDYMDGNTGAVSVLAGNLETGDFAEVLANGSTLSYPNYSKLDDKIIFSGTYNSTPVLVSIPMLPDKIHPASTATIMINEAKWGVWYAQGNRPLGEEEQPVTGRGGMQVYPNPAQSRVYVVLPEAPVGTVTLAIYNMEGLCLQSGLPVTGGKAVLDISGLAPGAYLVKAMGAGQTAAGKILVAP